MSTLPNSHRRVNPSASEAAIKEAVRARDGYRCVRCGMTAVEHVKRYGKTLDVHRLDPGTTYCIEHCVTLCRQCHGPEPKSPSNDPTVPLRIKGRGGKVVTIHKRLSECGPQDLMMVREYYDKIRRDNRRRERAFLKLVKTRFGKQLDFESFPLTENDWDGRVGSKKQVYLFVANFTERDFIQALTYCHMRGRYWQGKFQRLLLIATERFGEEFQEKLPFDTRVEAGAD